MFHEHRSHTKHVLYYHELCLLLINCCYMVLHHKFHPALLEGFSPLMVRAAWYAFPVGGTGLGQLPYVLVSLLLPPLMAEYISRRTKKWQRAALWAAAWGMVALFLMVIGKYAYEAVGLPR